MASQTLGSGQLKAVLTTEQIQKRVKELGRQISDDYRGQEVVHALGVLENSLIFLADLVRAIEVPLVCSFIKPRYVEKEASGQGPPMLEIFFSQDLDFHGKHVLLIEGLIHSGVTTDFLMADQRARGAASVKLVTLLDRQMARRVQLQPDYFGFLVDEAFLLGYGLGSRDQMLRNLPFIALGSR